MAAAQGELADVKKRVPSLEVRIAGDAAPARFVVDGSAIALSMLRTAMPLDPGEHTAVTIELANGGSVTKKATLAEREAKTLEISPPVAQASQASLAPPPPAEPAHPAATEPSPAESPASAKRSSTAEWVLIGAGGAALIAGASLFAVARGSRDAQQGCPSRTGCVPLAGGLQRRDDPEHGGDHGRGRQPRGRGARDHDAGGAAVFLLIDDGGALRLAARPR